MAPTTSQWQLRRREAGWEGSRRRSRDLRNTWPVLMVVAGCAYEAWRSGRAGSAWQSPMSIKGPLRRRGGCAVKVAGLTWGDLHGCPRCPVRGWFAGWCGTVVAERLLLAVEKSAEVVLPAGSMNAGRTEREAEAKDVRARDDRVDRSQPREGPGGRGRRVKPDGHPPERRSIRRRMRPDLTPPRRACGSSSCPAGISPRRSDASSRTPVPQASTG